MPSATTPPHRAARRSVSVKVEPIDAALVPLWYAVPPWVRDGIRRFLLSVARWPGVRPSVSSPLLRRAESSARKAGVRRSAAVLVAR